MERNVLFKSTASEDWLTACKDSFKKLNSSEKVSVILSLIGACDTSARYQLLKLCNDALHCDIISILPSVVLEKVMNMLSVQDLLNACKVSLKWDECLSQSTSVWKKKWLELGLGSFKDVEGSSKRNWKEDCAIGQQIHELLGEGKALEYDLDRFNDESGYISAMDYCNSILVVCHNGGDGGSVFHLQSVEWTFLCSFSVTRHSHSTCVRLLPSGLIVIGGSSGKISLWQLKKLVLGVSPYKVDFLHACHGHTSVVLSVDGCETLQVAVSGSRDKRVKIWSCVNGRCLRTLDFLSPVFQVSMYCCSFSTLCDFNFMLIHSGEHVFMQFWNVNDSDWMTQASRNQVEIAHASILPGIYIRDECLFYTCTTLVDGVQHSQLICKSLLLNSIIEKRSVSDEDCRVFNIRANVRKLMKVGSRFALLISDDYMMALDITNGKSVLRYFTPYSAATSPTLPQVTVGGTKWLDGLLYTLPGEMVIALAVYGGKLTLMSWEPNMPKFSSKED